MRVRLYYTDEDFAGTSYMYYLDLCCLPFHYRNPSQLDPLHFFCPVKVQSRGGSRETAGESFFSHCGDCMPVA